MMKYSFSIVFLIGLFSCATKKPVAQTAQPDQDYLIEGQFKILETDHFGNIYLVDNNNGISVYDRSLKRLFQYSVRSLGNITDIDVRNPQKTLVYYGDYLKIIFLDNTLSKIKELDLEQLGFWDIQAVALSRDNFIWMFDPVNGRLQKISDAGEVILSSNESFIDQMDLTTIQRIAVVEDKVLVGQEGKLLIFDEFGNFLRTMEVPGSKIKIVNGKAYAKDGQNLSELEVTQKIQFEKPEPITLPHTVRDYVPHKDGFYFVDDHGLFFKGQ